MSVIGCKEEVVIGLRLTQLLCSRGSHSTNDWVFLIGRMMTEILVSEEDTNFIKIFNVGSGFLHFREY